MKKKILSILLALVMVFSLIPTTMWAEEGNVAKIGDMEYATLADAIAAVPTDGAETTITMIADETISDVANVGLTVAAGKNIVLDLNGKTISGVSNLKSTHFIDNKGTLEITDSSANEDGKITFCAVADTGYSVENITIYNIGGKLTLTKGTIENATEGGLTYAVNTSSNAWGIGDDKYSEFTMTGGRLAGAKTDNTLRVYQNCAVGNVASHNTVSISGGVIDNGIFVDTFLYNGNANTANYVGANIDTRVDISGGTINGLIDLKIRHPFNTILNITGGDFTNAKLQVRKHNEYNAAFSEPTEPMVNISGGNFTFANTGKTFLPAYDSTTSSWTSYTDLYSITGGTYNAEPTAAYISEGYKAVDNGDGTWTVLPAVNYVAEIGDVKYESLEAAVEAAAAGNTIVLLGDVTYGADKVVAVWEKDFNLDLNGYTFTTNSTQSSYKAAGICFGDYATTNDPRTISVSNGTVRTAFGAGIYVDGAVTMTLSGLDVKQDYPANVQSTPEYSSAVRLTSKATVIIEGGSYEGKNAIAVSNSGGNVTVNGGDFTGDIFFSANTDAGVTKTITINGGNFNGGFVNANKGTLVITGGTFDHDPTAYVAEGYEAVDNGNGTWTVSSIKVAQIGNVKYATLADAIAAANASGNCTITILQDVDFSSEDLVGYKWAGSTFNPLRISATGVTLDLNEHRFYNMGNCAIEFGSIYSKDGTIASAAITNGTLEAGKTNGATNSYVLLLGGVDNVTISNITTNGGINACAGTNATISDCVVNGTKYYTVCAQTGSHIAINGTTFTKNTKAMDNTVATDTMFWVQGAGTDEDCITAGNPTGAFGASSITLSGGTFTKGSATFISGVNPVITGGTFDFDPTTKGVAEGYEVIDNENGTWTVSAVKVAEVNGVQYATLADAIAAANDGDTVELLADINLTAQLDIAKSLTINGNNKTVTAVKGTGTYALYVVDESAGEALTVNVSDLTLNTTGYQVAFMVNCDYNTVAYLNNVDIHTDGEAVYSNGHALVRITDCDFARDGKYDTGKDKVYYSVLIVGYGGEIEMTNGSVAANGGNAVGTFPSGGSITLNGVDVSAAENTEFAANYALWARNEDQTSYPEYCKDSTITVNSGNVNGGFFITDKYASGDSKNMYNPIITITGGTFDHDPTAYVAEGYEAVDNGNGTWTVSAVKVAEVNGVKYTTLAAAIAAANELEGATVTLLGDYAMETNEPGYGWTTLSHSAREKFLEISGTGLTFDLNGYTLSEVFNNTFKVTGESVTIKNGEMRVANYTNGDSGSYVIMADGATNLTIDELTTYGGINIAGGSTATINDLAFSGTLFYAVCSQEGSTVTLNGGTYNKAIAGSTRKLFWIEAGSTMNITGGTFNIEGNSANFLNGKVKPVITGGTFDFDPTTKGVADGYEAVEVTPGTWQVGEIKASAIAAQETVTESYEATYSANKKVVGENDVTLAQDTPITINLKADDNDVSTGNVLNDQYDVSTIVAAIVEAEGAKASTLNVSITVVKDNPEVVVENNKKTVTYEVHPVATITNEAGDTLGTYTISNDQLAGGATFVIKLPVPEALQTNGYVKVTHKLSDGSTVVYDSLAYDNDGFITIADVAEFSEFELEIAETVTASASYGFTLALKNKIEIPLYVYNLTDDAYNYFVEYSYTDADGLYVHNTVCLDNYSIGNGWYRFVVAEFSARQMSDEVYVRLYNNGTGENIYNGYYSIKQYCEYMIGGGTQTESLIKLCKAALDYGKAAQLYFDYNLSSPIADSYYFLNSGVTIGSEHASSFSSYLFDFVGATVSLKSQVQVNFYFRGGYYGGYTFKVNGEQVQPLEQGGYYVVSVSGITAKDLGKPVTVTVTSYGEEETFSYSPLAYAYYIQQNSQNNELIDVCKAMYLYWSAANDYLN